MSAQIQYLDNARPLRWHEALAEYVPARHRALARRHTPWIPIALLTLLFSAMTLLIRQPTAFSDEALFITTGHDYLDYWFSGGEHVDRSANISGLPFAYPVLAAIIDSIGGLWLVRAVSGALMVTSIVLISRVTTRLVNYRAGVLAAASMSLTGPVIFLGQHSTHDAVCLTLLAAAMYLAVTRCSYKSAIAVGGILFASAAFKYTAIAFAPPIVMLMIFVNPRRGSRVLLSAVTTTALVVFAISMAPNPIVEAISSTTFDRKGGYLGVIAPVSEAYLLLLLRQHLGILLIVAAFGAGILMWKSWSMTGVTLVLAAAAAILPASHMMLGELSSYEKHLGWAAMFLAPLAGVGLDRISRTRLVFAPVLVILAALALNAEVRSERMVYWGDVSPVIDLIENDPLPGTYLAVQATVMNYHSRELGYDIEWLETYDFWDTSPAGRQAIIDAVKNEEFVRVIVRGDETGNPAQNKAQRVLVDALYVSDRYEVAVTPTAGWRVFTQVDNGG